MKEYVISRSVDNNALIEQPKQAIISISNAGLIEKVCTQSEKFFGFTPYELVGHPFNKLVPAQVYDPNSPHFREVLKTGNPIQTTFIHKTGYFFTGKMMLKPDSEQNIERTTSLMSSTIAKLAYEGPLNSLMQEFQHIGKIGGWEYNISSASFAWSEGVYPIFDLELDATITPEHALYYFHDYQQRVRAAFRRCGEGGGPFSLEASIITSRNKVRWVRVTGRALEVNGQIQSLIGTIQDITEIFDATSKQAVFEDYIRSIINCSEDLVIALDTDLNVVMFNDAYDEQFKKTFQSDLVNGDSVLNALSKYPNEKRIYQRLWERALSRDSFCVEMPLAQRDEEMPIFEMRFTQVKNTKGETIGAAHIARNISSKIKVQEKLNYMARHDPLTGLFNRREFQHLLGRAIGNAKKRGTKHALLYMDLERFNLVNESCGQSAGDELLRQVSHILSSKVRQRDDLARIGGDEFTALLENCDAEDAIKVAENIRQAVGELQFSWEGNIYQIGISTGVVTLNENSHSPEQLLKQADSVCYAAKTSGRNKINVFRPVTTNNEIDDENELQIIKTIKHALEFEQYLKIYAQTIKPVTSAVWGDFFEILVRIEDEKSDKLLPEEFFPVAEKYDLTREIDIQIVSQVLNWLESNQSKEHRIKICTINLSPISVLNARFKEKLLDLLKNARIDITKLCFELSESLFINHLDNIQDFIAELSKLGCKIAVDGVGKTASHYEFLRQFDIHFVKIAGEIVKAIDKDPIARLKVENIHKITSVHGQVTVGLHVENEAILTEIRKLGLHFGQGFQIGRAVPLDQIMG